MPLNPEQESPLEQYRPRGEFFSVVGSVYRYLRFSGPPHIGQDQLTGRGLVDHNAFIGHMTDSNNRLRAVTGLNKDGIFSLELSIGRDNLQKAINRSTYFAVASIKPVGPLPIGATVNGEVVQRYPAQWSARDQVAAFLLDERRFAHGSLDVGQDSVRGKYALEPKVAALASDSFRSSLHDPEQHSWGHHIFSQHHKALIKGLDSPNGQQQFMKYVTGAAILLEAAKIKYEH